jgi:hypothetical protein
MKTQYYFGLILVAFLTLNWCIASPIISGEYCTVTEQSTWENQNPPVSIACLQSDGEWAFQGNFPEGFDAVRQFSGATMAKISDEKLVLAYTAGINSVRQVVVAEFTNGTGMSATTTLEHPGVENGQSFQSSDVAAINYKGRPALAWACFDRLFFYYQNEAGNWNNLSLVDSEFNGRILTPELFVDANQNLYLHYGPPRPTIWRFEEGTSTLTLVAKLSSPQFPSNFGNETHNYTALTEWADQLVLAFSSGGYRANSTQPVAVNKVAFQEASGEWKISPYTLQDSFWNLETSSFLFIKDGKLHALYAQFNPLKKTLNFRVKKWNGVYWALLSGESPALAQRSRYEFYNDNGRVLFSAIITDSVGVSQKVVLAWSEGSFYQLGKAVKSYPVGVAIPNRPGPIIKWSAGR